jgi:cyclopropane fatty-acyl-phospholipid synthase-like methyltransferase
MDWYKFVYRTSWRLGFTPWDRGATASGLVALVEGPNALPVGRAIDLGCGSGTNSVYLCKHGWQVTAVDMEPRAVRAARRKAEAEHVSLSVVEADVTQLREANVGDDFNLVVDVGCFHTLPTRLRDAYIDTVSAIAASGATLFMFAFSANRLAPTRSGVTRDEIETRFRGWELVSANASQDGRAGKRWRSSAVDYFAPWEYRLRRRPSS